MHIISTLGAYVKLNIYFIAYASRWKSLMLHKSSYFCLRQQWNVVILSAEIILADILRIIQTPRERKLAPNLNRNERVQLNGKAIGGSN